LDSFSNHERKVDTRDLTLGLARRAAVRSRDVEVVQPGAAVEFGVDGLDKPWLGDEDTVERNIHDNDTGNLLLRLDKARSRGFPSDDDVAATVPDVQDLKWNVGLAALASLECRTRGEGCAAERSGSTWAAVVDELVDGVGVVVEVGGQDSIGGRRVVRGDEGLEVVGNLGGIGVTNADEVALLELGRHGDCSGGSKAGEDEGGETHLAYICGDGFVDVMGCLDQVKGKR